MSTKDTGGQAFPCSVRKDEKYMDEGGYGRTRTVTVQEGGMSLRDYFAAKALSAMDVKDDCSYSKVDFNHDFPRRDAANYARTAYRIADAMIAARGGE